jgi:hypothetical protein
MISTSCDCQAWTTFPIVYKRPSLFDVPIPFLCLPTTIERLYLSPSSSTISLFIYVALTLVASTAHKTTLDPSRHHLGTDSTSVMAKYTNANI